MTQQAATILKRARERTAEARENHAVELVSWAAVTDSIGDAAARGETETTIEGPAGVDMRTAPTAIDTARKLAAGGFTTDWIERLPLRPGDPKFWGLLIRW